VVTREGRYRTPDRQAQILMREALKQKLKDCPVHVQRSEVEAMGVEMGLEGIEAARLFDRLKGVSWRGDYVRSETGWVAAWVREVN
jgi:predicted transcriptional regulator